MRAMFDEKAEESEDEYKGVGGSSQSDDEEDDSDDEEVLAKHPELVAMMNDDADENENRERVQARFNEEERDRDEKLVQDLLKGVHGGFRKRKHAGGALDLSDDSEDEAEYEARRRRQRRKQRRRKLLMEDEKIGSLATDPKTKAFFDTIEEDERKVVETKYVSFEQLAMIINDE
ncbi:DNA replication checkpoint mediator, MRC1 domain-containing protein [Myxozyma melibiosi]|uniref:DNA replication checkpoint mediator, MRC1 domain-containing protein n=1 Tax=Myxozyma melibiosi TaxID=54550 RepID=A0ABR1EZ73_9ASCO